MSKMAEGNTAPPTVLRPLTGLRVLVTRPAGQAASLSRLLVREGATPVEAPLIAIRTCDDDDGAIEGALRSLPEYDWLVFTSVNGVEVFFDRLSDLGLDATAIQGHSVAAIGPATAQALEERGVGCGLDAAGASHVWDREGDEQHGVEGEAGVAATGRGG